MKKIQRRFACKRGINLSKCKTLNIFILIDLEKTIEESQLIL